MLYTPMTKAALDLCFEAHRDQCDKSGAPYVFHPFHLAEQMETEEEVCVALLHDVLEDTSYTVADIRAAGMSDAVIEALLLMTRDEHEDYMAYVGRLAENPIARKVKAAELRHNSDMSRLGEVTQADLARVEKYARALELIEGMCGAGSD